MAKAKKKGRHYYPRKTRLNLLVSVEVRERIDTLQGMTGAESMTEVIRSALAIYERLVSVQQQDGKILLELADGTQRELVIVPA